MHKTPNLERALAITVTGAKVEQLETGGVTVFLDSNEDANLVPKIMELYGYGPNPTEVASSNVLHFVEIANEDEDMDDEDEDESIGDESIEDDDDSEEDEEDEGESDSGSGLNNLDDDGRSLKILSTPEAHRFALKIFQDVLGNENMAGYAAFLQDYDRFLNQHKGRGDIAFGGKRKKDAELSSVEVEDRIRANLLVLLEHASAGELPWATTNADDAIVIAAVEIAKKKQKNGRAGLLSALMKAISGDAGDAAVKAWDDKDSEKLHEVLSDAVKKVSGQAGRE